MAGTIVKIKQSAVAGRLPTHSAGSTYIEQGELALNTADQKLYSKDSSGTIFEIGGGGEAGANEIITTEFVATSSQTSFAVTYNVSNDHVNVYFNGVWLPPTDFTSTSGSTVVLDTGAPTGTEVVIQVIKALNLASGSDIDEHEFTATASQTSFTISGGYNGTSSDVEVYVNGVKLRAGDFTSTSGTVVVLGTGATVNDEVTIRIIKVAVLASVVNATATTGSAILPSGTTAQRDASPLGGYLRWNSTTNMSEIYNDNTSAWQSVGDVTLTGTQTLTNKTINAATLGGTHTASSGLKITGTPSGVSEATLELNTTNSGWNRNQIMFSDSNDKVGSFAGSQDSTRYKTIQTLDPNNTRFSTFTINAGSFVATKSYKIASVGNTDFTAIGASANTVGTSFTATGVGSGTGTATIQSYAGDNAIYFTKNTVNKDDDTIGMVMEMNMWGGGPAGNRISSLRDYIGFYGTAPLTLNASNVETPKLYLKSVGDEGSLRFYEANANGSNYIKLVGPATLSGDTTLTLPTSTDTLVGRNTTDTLTNKTLTEPVVNTKISIGSLDITPTALTQTATNGLLNAVTSGTGYFNYTTQVGLYVGNGSGSYISLTPTSVEAGTVTGLTKTTSNSLPTVLKAFNHYNYDISGGLADGTGVAQFFGAKTQAGNTHAMGMNMFKVRDVTTSGSAGSSDISAYNSEYTFSISEKSAGSTSQTRNTITTNKDYTQFHSKLRVVDLALGSGNSNLSNTYLDYTGAATGTPTGSIGLYNHSNTTDYPLIGLATTGISVTGNIAVTGTVDGRDVAADGTKLNTVETNADVTDSTNVVAALTAGTGVTISSGGTIAVGPVALTTVQVKGSQVDQLAATTQEGDVIVRSDEKKSYMHNGGSAGTMADFYELQTPDNPVLSVNGQTGAITAAQIKTAYEGETSAFTDAQFTKLANIETAADVTDATNVNAAGALMLSDTTTTGLGIVVDEDNMASNSATKLATQQSIKAYVDAQIQTVPDAVAMSIALG